MDVWEAQKLIYIILVYSVREPALTQTLQPDQVILVGLYQQLEYSICVIKINLIGIDVLENLLEDLELSSYNVNLPFHALPHVRSQHALKHITSLRDYTFMSRNLILSILKDEGDIWECWVLHQQSHLYCQWSLGNVDLESVDVVERHITVIASKDKELSFEIVGRVSTSRCRFRSIGLLLVPDIWEEV